MANRIIDQKSYVSKSRSDVAANSTVVQTGDFVSLSGGFATAATTSGKIEGLANRGNTYASDNQTVAKDTISYTILRPGDLVRVAVTGGTINNTKEGRFYNLSDPRTVNGASESTGQETADASGASATAAITIKQLRLVRFVTATLCDFEVV